MEIFVNRLLELYLNNTINLRHIMLYCAYIMAIESRRRRCDVTSPYVSRTFESTSKGLLQVTGILLPGK